MNTHKLARVPVIGKSWLLATAIFLVIAYVHCVRGQFSAVRSKVPIPMLQRILMTADKSYAIDFADPRGHGGRTLIMIENGKPIDQRATTVFIFGRNMSIDAVTGKIFPPTGDDPLSTLGYRWSIGGDSFFMTASLDAGDDILRIPMQALAIESDEARAFFAGRIEGAVKTELPTMIVTGGLATRPYTRLTPISDITEWKEAETDPPLPLGRRKFIRTQTFHYDIRAIDDTQIELFMTADGELSKRLFDGKTWKNLRYYDLQVTGEFLLFDDGRSLVSEHDGQWSVIPNIENTNPVVLPIANRVEGEPLILVEDKVERKEFFLHRDKLLDDRGRELLTVGDARDHTDRLRQVIDFVVSRRGR